ncbi:MAG TPA: hypothetical protein VMN57_11825, partial [Anaerolineales bacterium]|nr:hypothetical protein [Anaerolineales bacterium]
MVLRSVFEPPNLKGHIVRAEGQLSPAPSTWDRLALALSPVEFRPCRLPDLEIAQHRTRAGQPYLVLRNPTTNTYLRLEPREFELMGRMDGSRNLAALVLE